MSYSLILDPRATQQAREAYRYHEEAQEGLGERFMAVMLKEINYIQKYPHHFQKITGEIRQAVIPRFPYAIIYEQIAESIIVYAIFHTSQNPKKKFNND